MTKEHPWVMVAVIFVGLISAGTIIGYMSVNIPVELRQIPEQYQEQNDPHHTTPQYFSNSPSQYVGEGKRGDTYSMMYRSVIMVDYTIPDNARITNATYLIVGGGGGGG